VAPHSPPFEPQPPNMYAYEFSTDSVCPERGSGASPFCPVCCHTHTDCNPHIPSIVARQLPCLFAMRRIVGGRRKQPATACELQLHCRPQQEVTTAQRHWAMGVFAGGWATRQWKVRLHTQGLVYPHTSARLDSRAQCPGPGRPPSTRGGGGTGGRGPWWRCGACRGCSPHELSTDVLAGRLCRAPLHTSRQSAGDGMSGR
jgi:hypothetical protein